MFSLIVDIERNIEINGECYTVNDCFDNILKMYEIIEKNQNLLGIELAIRQLIGEIPRLEPKQMVKLYSKLIELYVNDGEKEKVEKDIQGNIIPVKHKQWFSFKHDAWAIYAGFIQAYGIDLKKERGKMRWCDFKALLNGLPSETRFKQIIGIRQRPYPTGKHSAKERQALMELKKQHSFDGCNFE